MTERSDRRLLLTGLSAFALVLAAIGLPWAQGLVYVRDDLPMFHLPWRALYAQALRQGDNLLWFPQIYGGYYAHGEGQIGMLHPLHLVLYRLLPLQAAFNIELLLNYVMLLGGTYLWLRRWQIERAAALFGALLFTYSGFTLLHLVHPNMVAVVAHLPWLLLAIEIAATSTNTRTVAGAYCAVGLLTASQLLLGHPQALWLSAVMEAVYALVRAGAARSSWRFLARLAAGKALGILAGAAQLLPTWDVVSSSARAAGRSADSAFSLVPADLTQLVAPYLSKTAVFGGPFPQEFALYNGAAASAALLWTVVRYRSLSPVRRSIARAALLLILVAVVLALGKYGYVYPLTAKLPGASLFRNAARYLVLAQLGMAVCGAVAFADVCSLAARGAAAPLRQRAALLLLPLVSLLVTGGAWWLRTRPGASPLLTAALAGTTAGAVGVALMIGAAGLWAAAAGGARWALPALMLFAALDQGAYGLLFLRTPVPPVPVDALVHGQAMPPDVSPERVQSDNNILMLAGVRLSGGYAAFKPVGLLDDLAPERLRIAGVRWVQLAPPWAPQRAVPVDREDWRGVIDPGPATRDQVGRPSSWARVREPMPRAWLVSRERVSADVASDIRGLDPGVEALVREDHGLQQGPVGSATIETDRPGRIELAADVPSRQLLILSERWHPGWQLTVDGQPAAPVQSDGDFIGAVVAPGHHTMVFRFWPASIQRGLWGSAVGLVLLVAALLVEGRRFTARAV